MICILFSFCGLADHRRVVFCRFNCLFLVVQYIYALAWGIPLEHLIITFWYSSGDLKSGRQGRLPLPYFVQSFSYKIR